MAKVRMGMVGGGEGAFIGEVHRMAAALDGQIELVCGAFSGSPDKSMRTGAALCLPEDRVYTDFQTMMTAEAALPANQRMQFVAIVTPNHLHFPVSEAALRGGFHVLCDKPATLNLDEALRLRTIVADTGLLFGLTHTYAGYPLVKEARARIVRGELGKLRKVVVDYPQGWLSTREENLDNKQAEWRLDPARAGVSSCMGDIGVHAANLAEYVTGLDITALCADLGSVVDGRAMDDDGAVLLRMGEGVRGVLLASQVSAGEDNGLTLRVYGELGGLQWQHESPNTLLMKWLDRPTEIIRCGGDYLSEDARRNTRTPAGHPEGFLEAFANLYRAFAENVRAYESDAPATDQPHCPGIKEAVRGMAFIELAVSASQSTTKWHELKAP